MQSDCSFATQWWSHLGAAMSTIVAPVGYVGLDDLIPRTSRDSSENNEVVADDVLGDES